MKAIYIVVCPVCKTQNVTDEPGSEEEEAQQGASIECTQCGNTVSARGGEVRNFGQPVQQMEPDLLMLNDL